MRNNSFHSAESIQRVWGHPCLAGNVCVRSVPLGRILRSLGEAPSRSRLRPGDRLRVRKRLHSVRTPVNSRALWDVFRTPQWNSGGCAPGLWGRLKTQFNLGYICICGGNFLSAGRIGIVRPEAWPERTVLLCAAPIVGLASAIVVEIVLPPNDSPMTSNA